MLGGRAAVTEQALIDGIVVALRGRLVVALTLTFGEDRSVGSLPRSHVSTGIRGLGMAKRTRDLAKRGTGSVTEEGWPCSCPHCKARWPPDQRSAA